MQLQTNDVGEAALKPRRTRKSFWRERWIKLTNGAAIERRAIRQTMHAPKLLANAMPRVILKEEFLQRSGAGWTKFVLPTLKVELANFVGAATAAGRTADEAEAEFLKPGPVCQGVIEKKRSPNKTPLFHPSIVAAKALRDKDDSPFKK
jgi:hypothetical protein